jgi:acetyltransferase-like isoleucine patch superfamily enzyme
MSSFANVLAKLHQPFMVYGYFDRGSGCFRKYTRMSSTVTIMNKNKLLVGDYVWVWHHSILDATEGLVIEEGCQLGAWVGVFTHGSENAIRLLGKEFINIPNTKRKGYTRGRVKIGAYTFVGAGSVILPGVTIGKGCLIGAGTLVSTDIPDYSVVVGNPGQIRGSTLDIDRRHFRAEDFSSTYYDADALGLINSKIKR